MQMPGKHQWVLEVLEDLRVYAKKNDLKAVSSHIASAKMCAYRDMKRQAADDTGVIVKSGV